MPTIPTPHLAAFLKARTKRLGMATRWLMVQRPRICPFDALLDLLPQGQRILDIGCGNGALLLLLARYRAPAHLMGVDINAAAVARARQLLADCPSAPSFELAVFDGRRLPPVMRTADYVFLVDVLHHVPRKAQKAFLERLFHDMQSGARLVMKDIDAASRLLSKMNWLHDVIVARQNVHVIPAGVAAQWLRQAGFEATPPRRQRRLWYPHYTIVARKP